MVLRKTFGGGLAAAVCALGGCASSQVHFSGDPPCLRNCVPASMVVTEPVSVYSPGAREIRARISTVSDAFDFLDSFWMYQDDPEYTLKLDDWRSLAFSISQCGGDCDNRAMAMGVLLQDDGFSPKILWVYSDQIVKTHPVLLGGFSHALCVLEKDACFTIADNAEHFDNYNSLDDFMRDYAQTQQLMNGFYCTLEIPYIPAVIDSNENIFPYMCRFARQSEWQSFPSYLVGRD